VLGGGLGVRSGGAGGGCEWSDLGGGEGGAISGQPAPSGGGLARDSLGRIFWAGWRGRLGLCGGGWAVLERAWAWCGGGAVKEGER